MTTTEPQTKEPNTQQAQPKNRPSSLPEKPKAETGKDKTRVKPKTHGLQEARDEDHAGPAQTILRFSPTAWAKLLFFRDRGHTEIGGFGISAEGDPLHIEEFVTVRQEATSASISFDDEAVADFFDRQVDLGRRPEQFARVWVHTHPGGSPTPSSVDEETFHRVFGRCDWAVMFVLARGGKTYARLRFNVGPGGQVMVPVEVDYAEAFDGADHEAWETEYKATIRVGRWSWDLDPPLPNRHGDEVFGAEPQGADVALWEADDWMAAFEELPLEERRAVLEELASRPDLWHEAEEVMPW